MSKCIHSLVSAQGTRLFEQVMSAVAKEVELQLPAGYLSSTANQSQYVSRMGLNAAQIEVSVSEGEGEGGSMSTLLVCGAPVAAVRFDDPGECVSVTYFDEARMRWMLADLIQVLFTQALRRLGRIHYKFLPLPLVPTYPGGLGVDFDTNLNGESVTDLSEKVDRGELFIVRGGRAQEVKCIDHEPREGDAPGQYRVRVEISGESSGPTVFSLADDDLIAFDAARKGLSVSGLRQQGMACPLTVVQEFIDREPGWQLLQARQGTSLQRPVTLVEVAQFTKGVLRHELLRLVLEDSSMVDQFLKDHAGRRVVGVLALDAERLARYGAALV